MADSADAIPDDIDTLKAALLAERAARRESEARAGGAEAMLNLDSSDRKRAWGALIWLDLCV